MFSNSDGLVRRPGRVYRVLEIGAFRRWSLTERARGILPVLRLNGVADIGRVQPERAHAIRD